MLIPITLVPSPDHHFEGHPENAGRFTHFRSLESLPFANQFAWLPSAPAHIDEISRVHRPQLLTELQKTDLNGAVAIDASPTYLLSGSWEAALNAAGGTLAVTRAIIQSDCLENNSLARKTESGFSSRGFALVRPPGHHAGPQKSSGFCLLNNLAVAAADALRQGIGRIAIIDFDGHHGNGTQDIFEVDPRVGYFSCHQQGSFPGTGLMEDSPKARGRILNMPLPPHAGDEALHLIAQDVLWPWLQSFKPDMLFISAGFDGHWADPVLNLGLTSAGYFNLAGELIAMADQFCRGRILFVLEGGYNPTVLVECIASVLAAMAGEKQPPSPVGLSAFLEPDIRSRLARLKALHAL